MTPYQRHKKTGKAFDNTGVNPIESEELAESRKLLAVFGLSRARGSDRG